MTGKVRIKRGEAWAERLKEQLTNSKENAAEWMEDHTQILRSNVNTLSGLVRLDDELGYLKLYYLTSFRHKLSLGLKKPTPLRNFNIACELEGKGISVPRPLACLEVPQGMLVMTEGLSGGGSLAELWSNQAPETGAEAMMQSAGTTLAKLHAAGYSYGDCHWDHLYWNGQRIYLITLDTTRKNPLGSIEQARDLARFTAHAEELGIGSALFERFLDTYLHGVTGNRREVVERMTRSLYRFRGQHLSRYGQRLV